MNHLKISLNISTDYIPNSETIKEYLERKTKQLLQEIQKMDNQSTSKDDITLPQGWEQTGTY